jgi:hypothetical protein
MNKGTDWEYIKEREKAGSIERELLRINKKNLVIAYILRIAYNI